MDKKKLIIAAKENAVLRNAYDIYKDVYFTLMRDSFVNHPFRHAAKKYKLYYGTEPNLINPSTMYEKILILEYLTDTSLWTQLADKAQVREYMKQLGFEDLLIPVYAIYDEMPSFQKFCDDLPDECVVKTNNSGGGEGVCIIHDKKTANLKKVYDKMLKCLKTDYGIRTATPHYSRIKPKVIVEKLLRNEKNPENSMSDYKIFCLNGEPVCINALGNRNLSSHTVLDLYYDTDMNLLEWEPQLGKGAIEKPKKLDEMIRLSRILSKPFPFVRLDFYETDERIYFGEFTFTPGLDFFISSYGEDVLHLGQRLDISSVKRIKNVSDIL